MNRMRIENIKLEGALKIAQENLAVNKKNQNNTSSHFILPSEFKMKWENILKNLLPNVFMNFLENPFIFMNIVQEIFIKIRNFSIQHIDSINKRLMALLNIQQDQARNFSQHTLMIYQNYMQQVFVLTKEDIKGIKAQAQEAVDNVIQHEQYGMLDNAQDQEKFFSVDVEQYQDYARELLVEENQDFE